MHAAEPPVEARERNPVRSATQDVAARIGERHRTGRNVWPARWLDIEMNER